VLSKMLTDINAGVELCRQRCEYFSVCGGGEPVNKLFENGSFVSTDTTYCRMTKMRATDLVLDLLDTVGLLDGIGQHGAVLSEKDVRGLGAAAIGSGPRDRALPSA
jgi:hypothetical protein